MAERKAEGAEVERCRREDQDAEGVEGSGVWGGGSPPHWVWGGGCATESGGLCPLPRIFFFDLELKMVSFGIFWVAF